MITKAMDMRSIVCDLKYRLATSRAAATQIRMAEIVLMRIVLPRYISGLLFAPQLGHTSRDSSYGLPQY